MFWSFSVKGCCGTLKGLAGCIPIRMGIGARGMDSGAERRFGINELATGLDPEAGVRFSFGGGLFGGTTLITLRSRGILRRLSDFAESSDEGF